MPPLPDQTEPLKRIGKIVNSFLARPDAGPFREPVDWRSLELWDYPTVITNMMDLGTVKRKLERSQYETAAQAAADIRLIWDNCKTYNEENSDFYLLAQAFSKRFEDRYRKVKNEFDLADDASAKATDPSPTSASSKNEKTSKKSKTASSKTKTPAVVDTKKTAASSSTTNTASPTSANLDHRTKFAASLMKLNGIELAHVLQELELHAPQALEQTKRHSNVTTNTRPLLEIVVDDIPPQLFTSLQQYVLECVGESNTSTSNKKRKKM